MDLQLSACLADAAASSSFTTHTTIVSSMSPRSTISSLPDCVIRTHVKQRASAQDPALASESNNATQSDIVWQCEATCIGLCVLACVCSRYSLPAPWPAC